jgi:hypothetical protein
MNTRDILITLTPDMFTTLITHFFIKKVQKLASKDDISIHILGPMMLHYHMIYHCV